MWDRLGLIGTSLSVFYLSVVSSLATCYAESYPEASHMGTPDILIFSGGVSSEVTVFVRSGLIHLQGLVLLIRRIEKCRLPNKEVRGDQFFCTMSSLGS